MKVVIKDHEMYDAQTGYRVQPFYGSAVTGVDFQSMKKDAPDGTEILIRNIWDHWNIFDPDSNSYTTIIKSKYLQAEEIYRPEQLVINNEVIGVSDSATSIDSNRVGGTNDYGNDRDSNTSGISDSDVHSSIQEQSDVPDTVSEDNSGEHTDIGTIETAD